MNRIIITLALSAICHFLPAQDVTYVKFNRDCMRQMVYQYAYPNVKGEDPIYAYSIRPNVLENYVFVANGASHYSPTLPDGVVSCSSLDLSDGFVSAINRDEKQLLVVLQRKEGGYWLMPIGSATLIARKASKYWVRSKNCSFTFDTTQMESDVNLALTGSPTAVYFQGTQVRSCLREYSFHCESPKSGQLRSDIDLIPAIGFSSDRTGSSSAKAMENEMRLIRLNGQDINEQLEKNCPEEDKIEISKSQKPTEYGYDKETYGYTEADKETESIKIGKPTAYNYDGDQVNVHCAEKMGEGYHIVQKGDNLRGIARTYGVDMASIIKWNKIKDPNKIEVCQAIWYQKPPANAEEIVNKKAEKPVQRIATENKVIDQRKLNKMTSEKGIRPQAHSTEDEDYDSWRLKSSNASAQKPVAHDTEEEPAERPLIHRVKKGEYLYKLSKMYDCPEECIRQANKMPEEGDVDFIIGQRVVIPECDCLKSKTSAKKGVAYESPITTAKNKKMRSETLLDPVTYGYDEKDEKQVSTQTKRRLDEWEDDVDEKTTSVAKTKSSAKKSAASNVPQFKEHLSRQGDTLRSIATKYKVDPAELAQVNGMGLNEEVTPGKWILVPIHEPEEK